MKILVCLKVVKGEINPFDESALECALRLSNDVTVISMCPKSAKNVLLPLTRLGAKVILISDSAYAGSDTLATSYILSKAINLLEYDLILCGRQTVDGDTAQVGPMLSQKLNLPLITNALSLEIKDGEVKANTRLGEEKTNLPSLVTVERGYVLRFASIFSKLGEIQHWDNSNIFCDVSKCGIVGSPTRVLEALESERGKRKCQFISMEELIPLVEKLKTRQEVKDVSSESKEKLKSVWVIGDEVLEKAKEIATEVISFKKMPPEEIAKLAIQQKPEVILWNADLWGRRNAPIVAAMLETGLCADCTRLDVEDGMLMMYRPAQGGNITAKIKCLTMPQMATVRTKTVSSDIIVSGGKGVKNKMDAIEKLAKTLGAEICASRGLVDANGASYDKQIGLTGKTVSPKVYIAIGISGAIHHTVGIEGAGTIIAINPDKNARIFDYSDYGIIDYL